ncbi:MAG: hypothetical protein AAF376_10455 [Pseudomonadota bacterium]
MHVELLRPATIALWGLSFILAMPAFAQTEDKPGIFASYEEMRAATDALIEDRQIAQWLSLLTEVPPQEAQDLMAAQMQFLAALPFPLTEIDRVLDQPWENGYRQELLSYSDGDAGYLFVRYVIHERDDGTIAIVRMSFNTNIDAILPFF